MRTDQSADLLRHAICDEYLELPGLSLTPAQVRRRWCLDAGTCVRLLAALSAEGFLALGPDGRYRLGGEPLGSHHRASA